MAKHTQILDALAEAKRAEGAYHMAFKTAYPVGSPIEWERCGHGQCGTVLFVGNHRRLRVLNARTGNTLWIGFYDVHGSGRDHG